MSPKKTFKATCVGGTNMAHYPEHTTPTVNSGSIMLWQNVSLNGNRKLVRFDRESFKTK